MCACVFRDRYNDHQRPEDMFGQGGEAVSDEITQQTLLPGVKDPNLWMVKCLLGTEKETCLRLMQKCIAYQSHKEPLQIRLVTLRVLRSPPHSNALLLIVKSLALFPNLLTYMRVFNLLTYMRSCTASLKMY